MPKQRCRCLNLPRSWFAAFAVLLFIGPVPDLQANSLIYKNYIVRYDRGWDILCEPYRVRQGDWVLKLFRQKGEIAHQDFREFLSIFQRLNPHIRDIDMIRPGQSIDIPLRKLEHGSLPGQATGVVTIPFVALSQVDEMIVRHSQPYKVQWGDTVSRLIARHYGPYGSPGYNEGIKLFKAANADVVNLDQIYAGQTLHLPDPAMREESWYASLYDEQGELRQGVTAGDRRTGHTAARGVRTLDPPTPSVFEPLQAAAAVVGGTLSNKGTHYVPRPGRDDFEIDLSRHPLLALENQSDLVFTQSNDVMGMDKEALQGIWSTAKVVAYDTQSSVEEIVAAIFDTLGDDGGAAAQGVEIGFDDQGVRIRVHARWIRSESDGRQVCIRPIEGPADQTPENLRRYLEQHGIILKELLPGGRMAQPAISDNRRHAVRDILALAPTGQKDFVQGLARALRFSYSSNVGITFPYAGVMVTAHTNLLSAGDGRELLVDFGDLYGDALGAIRQSGPVVVQITPTEGYDRIAWMLLSGLDLSYDENPSFLAAPEAARFNTVVTVQGILLSRGDDRTALLTGAALPAAVAELIGSKGVAIVQW